MGLKNNDVSISCTTVNALQRLKLPSESISFFKLLAGVVVMQYCAILHEHALSQLLSYRVRTS
jgi:hypothetical protein